MKKIIDQITPREFIKKFINRLPKDFYWQQSPMQMYPLGAISEYLNIPTPLFRPNYNSIIFLESGSLVQQIETKTYHVLAPAILLVLSSAITSIQSLEKGLSGYYLLVEEKTISTILTKKDSLNLFTIDPVLRLSEIEANWIKSLYRLLYKELDKPSPNRRVAHGLFHGLLFKILELSESSSQLTRDKQIAIEFKKLVYTHYKENKNISFYANKMALSENYLNRCVKKAFQKSTKQLVNEIRILQSQLLLWDLSRDISEISFEMHFEDPSYFSRIFKKVTGQTPTEYRISIMHDLS